MKLGSVGKIGAAVVLAGAVFAWNGIRQEREYRRLIAAGDAALARDQTFEAIEDFSGALALKRDSMLARLKRGDSYRRRGELIAAARDLREAAAIDPTATRPLELLGDVNMAIGRFGRAADAYRRYVALDDSAQRLQYKLALALYRGGDAALALEPVRRAIALDERLVEAQYLLALCLSDRGRDLDATRALRRALDVNPAYTPAREELARISFARGRARDGLEQLEALATLEPSEPRRLVDVGLAYARLGRTEQALLALRRAAERYPDSDQVYVGLGRTWIAVAEAHHDRLALAQALESLQLVASRPAASSETLTLYGWGLFLSGDAAAAERVLQQATSRSPIDPAAFLYLASAAEREGHLPTARDALVKHAGLVEDGDQKRTLAGRVAMLSLRMNDAETAAVWAQRALHGGHRDLPLLTLLATADMRRGDPEAARALVAEGLTREPKDRALLQLRKALAP